MVGSSGLVLEQVTSNWFGSVSYLSAVLLQSSRTSGCDQASSGRVTRKQKLNEKARP